MFGLECVLQVVSHSVVACDGAAVAAAAVAAAVAVAVAAVVAAVAVAWCSHSA